MKHLVTIGEALIDFIPQTKGISLKDVETFKRVAGGAPANVAAAFSKLGGKSIMLSQVGNDAFGDYIIDSLNKANIETKHIKKNKNFDTSLAFVSLKEDGNRDFKFYRRTAADLNYNKNDIPENILENVGAIHFCSVDLVESPMKYAHIKLIEMAKKENLIISFDPNLRLPLWENHNDLKNTVNEFIKLSNIVKISDEELEFITGKNNIHDALPQLFNGSCDILIYTLGVNGAMIFNRNSYSSINGLKVNSIDTTGAGDSFIGSFLYSILSEDNLDLKNISLDNLTKYLEFSNIYAACTTTKLGGIDSMSSKDEIESFKKSLNLK